ncbi:regulator of Ty1 Transposition, partial [Coemansia sp. Benny D115]
MDKDSERRPANFRIRFSDSEQKEFVRNTDPLFDGVVYWINPILGDTKCKQLAEILENGGARAATLRIHKSDGPAQQQPEALGGAGDRPVPRYKRLNGPLVNSLPQMAGHVARFHMPAAHEHPSLSNVLRATHVISPDTHFSEHAACVQAGVHVVTPLWVERSAFAGWQYVERYFSASARDIFSGMVVAATHMPKGDKETLLTSIMALGGQWREKMRPDVTHLVAMQEEGLWYEFVQKHRALGMVAILPHWFQETLNLMRRVPQEAYVFPDPPMLRGEMQRPGQEAMQESNSSSILPPLAEDVRAHGLPRPGTQFLRGYVVAIGTQLRYSLSPDAIDRLVQRLEEAGASVHQSAAAAAIHARTETSTNEQLPESLIDDWDRVDVLICQHREGYEYSKATRLGKLVGTLVWLYQCMLGEQLVPPTISLLHYPAPPTAVVGMDRVVVSLSGYKGAARTYLRTLVTMMGGRCTGSLSRDNTHLVTACSSGPKYAMAVRASINVVNHLWVEQCYQRWRLLSVTHPSFVYFPRLPLLNSMVGDAEVLVPRLRSWVDVPRATTVAAEWSDMDVLSDSDLDDDTHASTTATAAAAAAATAGAAAGDEDESPDEAASVNESSEDEPNAAATSTQNDDAPAAPRHTSRAAAMAATKSLGELMRAANLFESEMRQERLYKYRRAPAPNSTSALDKPMMALAVAEPASKRRKTHGDSAGSDAALPSVRIMLTHVQATPDERTRIAQMGGSIVERPEEATHLVARDIRRTFKMLAAIGSGRIHVVSRRWLDDSLQQGEWADAGTAADDPRYALVDVEFEQRWGFTLAESLRRARHGPLLSGVTVLVTPATQPGLDILAPLVEISGGKAVADLADRPLRKMLRANARLMRAARAEGRADVTLPLLVLSCREDAHLWDRFRVERSSERMVFSVELLLTGVLRQHIQALCDEFALPASDDTR